MTSQIIANLHSASLQHSIQLQAVPSGCLWGSSNPTFAWRSSYASATLCPPSPPAAGQVLT